MIFDEQLNLLGETLLTENKFNYRMYFIAEDGLYLSLNTPNNPNFDENKLQFELLSLQFNNSGIKEKEGQK